MSQDKQTQQEQVKQKIIAGTAVLVLLILIWQVAGLFGGKSKTKVHTAPQSTLEHKYPTPPGNAMSTNGSANGIQPEPAAVPTLAQTPPRSLTAEDKAIVERQKADEKKLLQVMNDLQYLKVEQQIAETNSAIATAKLAAVKAEKGLSDILNPPTQTSSFAAVNEPFVANTPAKTGINYNNTSGSSLTVNTYNLASITEVDNKWLAVISYGDKLYNVAEGDILPPDRATVQKISKNNVVIIQNNIPKTLNLIAEIQ